MPLQWVAEQTAIAEREAEYWGGRASQWRAWQRWLTEATPEQYSTWALDQQPADEEEAEAPPPTLPPDQPTTTAAPVPVEANVVVVSGTTTSQVTSVGVYAGHLVPASDLALLQAASGEPQVSLTPLAPREVRPVVAPPAVKEEAGEETEEQVIGTVQEVKGEPGGLPAGEGEDLPDPALAQQEAPEFLAGLLAAQAPPSGPKPPKVRKIPQVIPQAPSVPATTASVPSVPTTQPPQAPRPRRPRAVSAAAGGPGQVAGPPAAAGVAPRPVVPVPGSAGAAPLGVVPAGPPAGARGPAYVGNWVDGDQPTVTSFQHRQLVMRFSAGTDLPHNLRPRTSKTGGRQSATLYSCQGCGYAGRNKAAMLTHVRSVHTPHLPGQVTVCANTSPCGGFRTNSSTAVVTHLTSVHGVDRFKFRAGTGLY